MWWAASSACQCLVRLWVAWDMEDPLRRDGTKAAIRTARGGIPLVRRVADAGAENEKGALCVHRETIAENRSPATPESGPFLGAAETGTQFCDLSLQFVIAGTQFVLLPPLL